MDCERSLRKSTLDRSPMVGLIARHERPFLLSNRDTQMLQASTSLQARRIKPGSPYPLARFQCLKTVALHEPAGAPFLLWLIALPKKAPYVNPSQKKNQPHVRAKSRPVATEIQVRGSTRSEAEKTPACNQLENRRFMDVVASMPRRFSFSCQRR